MRPPPQAGRRRAQLRRRCQRNNGLPRIHSLPERPRLAQQNRIWNHVHTASRFTASLLPVNPEKPDRASKWRCRVRQYLHPLRGRFGLPQRSRRQLQTPQPAIAVLCRRRRQRVQIPVHSRQSLLQFQFSHRSQRIRQWPPTGPSHPRRIGPAPIPSVAYPASCSARSPAPVRSAWPGTALRLRRSPS